jgi:hypothetical protein
LFAASILLTLDPAAPAYAYLDPGTGSIMLQLILGGIAGGLAVGKIYWHNIKSFLARSYPGGRSPANEGRAEQGQANHDDGPARDRR